MAGAEGGGADAANGAAAFTPIRVVFTGPPVAPVYDGGAGVSRCRDAEDGDEDGAGGGAAAPVTGGRSVSILGLGGIDAAMATRAPAERGLGGPSSGANECRGVGGDVVARVRSLGDDASSRDEDARSKRGSSSAIDARL